MTNGEHKLLVVYLCDYRVLEEVPTCGCQQHMVRCLVAKGGSVHDPHDVTTNDCLRCTDGRAPWETYS